MITIDKGSENLMYSGVCLSCKHFNGEMFLQNNKHTCQAFNEIPLEIWNEKNPHTSPYPGDNGIMFEPTQTPED